MREAHSYRGSAWIHSQVKNRGALKIRRPSQHFRLDEACQKVIFIAGGIGITPVLAVARRAQSLGMDYQIHYSGRQRKTMAFIAELAGLHGDRLHVYASDEAGRRCGPPRLGADVV